MSPVTEFPEAWWYGDPADPATCDQIDPLIREACRRINRSGWAWTAEACQGHPAECDAWKGVDWNDPQAKMPDVSMPWADNRRPMIRLVCARRDEGRLLDLLFSAAEADRPEKHWGFDLWPGARNERWVCHLVYLQHVQTVAERDAGLLVLERFAALVTP